MPIPIIPIVAVLGAGTLAYFIGRSTAPCPESGDAGEDEQESEETGTPSHTLGSGGEATERDATWKHMTKAEALEVLDLAPDAGPDVIREAHRRIMQRVHPDQGGPRYLAAAVDRAKVVLLR